MQTPVGTSPLIGVTSREYVILLFVMGEGHTFTKGNLCPAFRQKDWVGGCVGRELFLHILIPFISKKLGGRNNKLVSTSN